MASLRPTAWTWDEFIKMAARLGGPKLAIAHQQLLAALTDSPPLLVRFDGQGASEASYNVYAADIRKALLRVRATGKLQACIPHIGEEGQPERMDFYRQQLGGLVKKEADDWAWLTKSVSEIDHSHFGRLLKAVAFCPPHPA